MLYDPAPSWRTSFQESAASHPKVLHVETTTRCNMRCGMCVKQSTGNRIGEQDLSLKIFRRLGPDLAHVHSLVLNGIGEPLLHPDLEAMIAFARLRMPDHGRIGFQTNGLALTAARASALMEAGLDVVCVSVDSVSTGDQVRESGSQDSPTVCGHPGTPSRAMEHLRRAKETGSRPFRLGVECVLLRDSFEQLPRVVTWAAEQGADFVLVSHMLPFGKTAADQCLFNPNTREATAYFETWQDRALRQGVDLREYFRVLWKFKKTDRERLIVEMVRDMQAVAATQEVAMNIRKLLTWDNQRQLRARLDEVLEAAGDQAEKLGIDLELPPTHALLERHCPFMEQDTVFVDTMGRVAPCHFLWHRYSCAQDGLTKQVWPRRFGTLTEATLGEIWADKNFTAFRDEARTGSYPACASCNTGPCSDTRALGGPFQSDCLGSTVPCGHCPWVMGMLKCLDLTTKQ